MSDRWSLGVLIGLPAAGLLVLILLALAVVLFYAWRTTPGGFGDRGFFAGSFAGVLVALVLVVAGTAWLEWPWSAEYHRWHVTTGTVTDVSSRLLASDTQGGGTTQRFVVNLAGIGERSCDDTRCATVKVGDVLTLSCKRAWQYVGSHGYDCAFVEVQHHGG